MQTNASEMTLTTSVLDIYWWCANTFGLINGTEVNSKLLTSLLADSSYILAYQEEAGESLCYIDCQCSNLVKVHAFAVSKLLLVLSLLNLHG